MRSLWWLQQLWALLLSHQILKCMLKDQLSRAAQTPVGELEAPLGVAYDACAMLKAGSLALARLTKELSAGELNFCIARGCIRSLQDVLVTLVRHTALLLKDMMLRLDFWDDQHDAQWRQRVRAHAPVRSAGHVYTSRCDRAADLFVALMESSKPTRCMAFTVECVQVDKLIKTLGAGQDDLTSVLANLKQVEASLAAPGTGVAGQPHAAIDSIAKTSQELNDVLRRADQAQAELPPVRHPSEVLSQQLTRVRIADVDATTQVRIRLETACTCISR
jgi:hypothetical protein